MEKDIINSFETLDKMRQNPWGSFFLTEDIDLGGQIWEPLDFHGTLDGNGKRISNFRITNCTDNGHQGFFGLLGEDARVCNVILTGIYLVAAENAVAIGALAGVNHGTIRSCSVGADAPFVPTPSKKRNVLTGEPDDSCLIAPKGVCAGAIAGINAGMVTDVRSYLRLLTPKQGLCAVNSGTVQGTYADVSQRTQLLPQSAIAMRREIVAHMETQGNFCWIPGKDMGFTSAYTGSYKIYEKDAVHYGLPYTQKYGSVERAQYCMTEDAYVADWLPAFSDAAQEAQGSKETPWDVYLGNDCSGAVYWAWQRTCPSVEFGYTGDMIPTEENQKLYGILPVGEYRAEGVLTKEIVQANMPERIAQCYAQLHMGDAIIMRDPGYGHTRLVARDPMVVRKEDGSIDLNASYLATHEQGVGKGSSGRNSTWQLNARYTFRDLLETGYLPITNRDLREGYAPAVQVMAEGITNPFSGKVRSNYRIISTTVALTHRDTRKKYESVEFTALDKNRNKRTPKEDGYARSTVREAVLSPHRDTMQNIPKGEYTYTVSVCLSTGNTYAVHSGSYEE